MRPTAREKQHLACSKKEAASAFRSRGLTRVITGHGVRDDIRTHVAGHGLRSDAGLAAAASAQILGAAVVMIGDMNQERLQHAQRMGFEPIDLTQSNRLEELIGNVVGVPGVDASIDAVGFEARGHGAQHTTEAPATVLNALMGITRADGPIGIPGLY